MISDEEDMPEMATMRRAGQRLCDASNKEIYSTSFPWIHVHVRSYPTILEDALHEKMHMQPMERRL